MITFLESKEGFLYVGTVTAVIVNYLLAIEPNFAAIVGLAEKVVATSIIDTD